MISALLFVAGTTLIIFGAAWFVDGSSSLAKRVGISDLVIGLTVVGLGTSSPELAVNLSAALNEIPGMAAGNIIGSNILNILLILGITALIKPLGVTRATQRVEIPLVLLSAVILWVMSNDILLDGKYNNVISRSEGIVLLGFFVIFMAYIIYVGTKGHEKGEKVTAMPVGKSVLWMVAGLAGLVAGSHLMVKGAVEIARMAGLSETVIGLTIVAIGTSTPELATSAVAAWKGKVDLALGNIVGSNIMNVFLILGLTAVIFPVGLDARIGFDLLFNIFTSLVLLASTLTLYRMKIVRLEGALFLAFYLGYVYYVLQG